jgi:hypothetical protein
MLPIKIDETKNRTEVMVCVAPVIEHIPRKHEALSSSPNTAKISKHG